MIPRFPIHNFLFHPEGVFHIVNGESDIFVFSGGEKMQCFSPIVLLCTWADDIGRDNLGKTHLSFPCACFG